MNSKIDRKRIFIFLGIAFGITVAVVVWGFFTGGVDSTFSPKTDLMSIVMYAIDDTTGRLRLVGHESTQGKTPRNFAIDPSGTFLLAANQDSGTIVSLRINQHTGILSPTGQTCQVSMPVCLKMVATSAGR